MGSGKTTIGKLLAQAKKRTFIDLDEYIEQKEKSSISDLFIEQEEAAFRKLESSHLKTLASEQSLVVATGGGTPCSKTNASILKTGYVIYLKCPLKTLTDRLYSEKANRPLISEIGTKTQLYGFIREQDILQLIEFVLLFLLKLENE